MIDLVHLADDRSVVLRRVPVLDHVPGHRPADEISNEARALRLLVDFAWAPTLLATDPDGLRCGVAASIQTVIPGRVEVIASADWIDVMAAAIRAIAEVDIHPEGLPAFDPWIDPGQLPPDWTSNPRSWRRAADAVLGWTPHGDQLIHRDLHPGNVLVDGDHLGGIVDWVHARRGPIDADVSRCRVETALLAGPAAADELLERCADLVPDYDHRWDLLVALELAPWSESLMGFNVHGAKLDPPTIHDRLDAVVTAAFSVMS